MAMTTQGCSVLAWAQEITPDNKRSQLNLGRASDKKLDPDAKIALLKETKQLEAATIEEVEELAEALCTQTCSQI